MAFPGEGLEAAYRNSLEEVADMLKSEHGDNYMVYNLSERTYDFAKLNHQVLHFGWPDHHAPPMKLLFTICASIDSWLRLDSRNVVCIHCKGGKGRTGTVICAYLLYCGLCKDEKDAMDRFGARRMAGDKVGITQPAQKRYIRYFKEIVYHELKLHSQRMHLYRIIFSGVPIVDKRGRGCEGKVGGGHAHALTCVVQGPASARRSCASTRGTALSLRPRPRPTRTRCRRTLRRTGRSRSRPTFFCARTCSSSALCTPARLSRCFGASSLWAA
jgi:protein-tyrosine phosphatase